MSFLVAVNVFRSFAFPNKPVSCELPTEVSIISDRFIAHYLTEKVSSKELNLTFLATEGHAVLEGNYDLHVSTCEMCILMLFNSSEYFSYDGIQHAITSLTCTCRDCCKHSVQATCWALSRCISV